MHNSLKVKRTISPELRLERLEFIRNWNKPLVFLLARRNGPLFKIGPAGIKRPNATGQQHWAMKNNWERSRVASSTFYFNWHSIYLLIFGVLSHV